ncbi:MAG TPA: ATPase domain-containing protein [Candidatus Binatia bacterium]|nr:ATPase domain-containing protein [Candidatus Binatia bacterium]
MNQERISTGIAGLDTLLRGGFIRGRSYLYAGEAGTGKTIACLQLVASRLKAGDKAVYVTVDERPSEILESAAALGWNLQPYIQEKQLIVLDAAPYFGTRGGGEKGIDPQKIVADLGNYVRRLGATLLIIDPVTPFILPPDSTSPPQDQARSLIQLVQTQIGVTNLFTAQRCADGAPNRDVRIEEHLAAGVLIFSMIESAAGYQRSVTIKKMRGVAIAPVKYKFTLRQDDGIVIDQPASVSAAAIEATPMFDYFDPAKPRN